MTYIKKQEKNPRTCGLVITFNPDIKLLDEVLSSLVHNVEKIFIFDNTTFDALLEDSKFFLDESIKLFSESKNIGIAAAQNFLLRVAVEEGFEYAVVSDQDTVYPVGYVSDLNKHFLGRDDIAAIFPGWVDIRLEGKEKYPGQYILDSKKKLSINNDESSVFEISHGISSGMIINIKLLHQIGLMNEDLFIDWVDNEWCWRARAHGFTLLAVPTVKVQHKLGDSIVRVFGKNFVKRGSVRNFYIIRNGIYLILYSSVPVAAKSYLIKKVIHHTIFSFIVSNNKFVEVRFLARAWLHGLKGKLGKV